MRKRIKIGGAETVFICNRGRTENKLCIEDFVEEFNFTFYDVPGDGNCFFYTLEKYYRRKGDTSSNKSYKELRALIVSNILENIEYYSQFGIDHEDVLNLTQNSSWNNEAGDIVIPAAANTLHLKIVLYDLKAGQRGPPITTKRIIRHIYPEVPPIPDEIIHILRINNNHFGLLVPNDRIVKNTVETTTKHIEHVNIKTKNSLPTRRKPKVAPSPPVPNITSRPTRRKPKVAPVIKSNRSLSPPGKTKKVTNNNIQHQRYIKKSLKNTKPKLNNNFFDALNKAMIF